MAEPTNLDRGRPPLPVRPQQQRLRAQRPGERAESQPRQRRGVSTRSGTYRVLPRPKSLPRYLTRC